MKNLSISEAADRHNVDYARHGFRNSFGTVTRTCEISVWIVHSSSRHNPEPFGVYLFHGAPAGQFWRNSAPLVRCKTVGDARQVAETLFGIVGSGDLAQFISTP